ncbi:hypothetical protein Cgig2_000203 [Carnegiea gigantea]|uniref:Reverse transcriptase zinc-binding domain-containing protein n=1 Tax=Carnegiea gigantea TaxID=171969 RepID=A0A9Q1QLE7_9CARY|nr:hypothetical protein Cgig2_000203 [Carnegiea gigantea]
MARMFQFGVTPGFRGPSLFVPSRCRVQLTIRLKWPTLSTMTWVTGKKTSFAAPSILVMPPPFSKFPCAALGPRTSSSGTSLRMVSSRSDQPTSWRAPSERPRGPHLAPPLAPGRRFGPSMFLLESSFSAEALPTCSNQAHRLKNFNMSCSICGTLEGTSSHIFLECPLALEIWSSSPFDSDLWAQRFPSAFDCFLNTSNNLTTDALGEAIAFITGDRVAKLTPPSSNLQESLWRPPDSGLWKLKFDAEKLQEWGRGVGFVVMDSLGDIVLASS